MDNNEKAKKLEQDLMDGLGMMSNGIKGLTEILMDRLKNAAPNDAKEIQKQIKEVGLDKKVSEFNETLKKFKQDFGGYKK